MSDSLDVETAALHARMARERFFDTAQALQDRLAPGSLLDDAVSGVKDGAGALALTSVEAAQRRPRAAVGIVATAAVLVLRRPLVRFGRRLFGRRRKPTAATLVVGARRLPPGGATEG